MSAKTKRSLMTFGHVVNIGLILFHCHTGLVAFAVPLLVGGSQ